MAKYQNKTAKKHTLLFFLLLAGCSGFAYAQQGVVTIEQDPKIDQLMQVYKTANARSAYYTIQVGFGNYEEAEELKDLVKIDFPEWTPQIIFDSPTYRVRIGQFRTKLEAERRFIEVRKKYPAALILKPESETRMIKQQN
ncbi:SPOR domain-containing protein [Lentiprolixibacter aurantiacus]|uniref:SPOR domain-containing protein n=1 Tax=Lentiprolixibacter aurantiacus TaxID=2993939 RepID=A0AAE3MKR6_9FLAO|nr:SPOR domain-containing protein [Lentiprolixibacter aurantiacus]MCX2719018.1 SPOR domain-containing protein [Lentiprolixibacter aurantiacus]